MISTRTTGRISSAAAAVIAAAVLVAGATAPAYAADPTTDAPKSMNAKPEKAKKYCMAETLTGSRVQRKICRTREDWIARGSDPVAGNK